MKKFYFYFISMLIFFLVFRFFGFIMAYAIRFWFIVIPAALLLYYYNRKKRESKTFQTQTGLDPDKEVKLKEEPEIIVEDEEKE